MGNSIIHSRWFVWAKFVLLASSIACVCYFGYPYADSVMNGYKISYYEYEPATPVVSEVDTGNMAPSIAVPILMYHGVLYEYDEENTVLSTFIEQMEMLKREGFETISVDEFYRFKQGTFTLPPKPIIITFDDGRKDSYYTTDDIFRQLGFKATLFYASGPLIDGDSFYLSWKELRSMRETGRWEIEAHGRDSHRRVPVDASEELKETNRYLISKMFLTSEGRLETDEEFLARVEADYQNGITDLKNNVGIDARFYAVPLNDYGNIHSSNYDNAVTVNLGLTQKYFKLAFIEANSPDKVEEMNAQVYNYAEEDAYHVRRIEVKNMPAETLRAILDREYPRHSELDLSGREFETKVYEQHQIAGSAAFSDDGYILKAIDVGRPGVATFGQLHWRDYKVTATMHKLAGNSISLIGRFMDGDHYVMCGLSGKQVFLRQIDGTEITDLAAPIDLAGGAASRNTIAIQITGDKIRCAVNDITFFDDVWIPYEMGATGMKIWGQDTVGEAVLEHLTVTALE